MKSVEPNADLPPANSHTMLTYSALPVRRQYQRDAPRNMTGVYLSHEAYGMSAGTQHTIPPLAKPRGVVYQPRTMPGRNRPQQQHRNDANNVVVRKRGDAKAFRPLPIKKAKPKVSPRHEYHSPSPHILGSKPDYQTVTRKTARNWVPASNSGITHFEDLRSDTSSTSDKTTQGVEVLESMLDNIDLTAKDSDKSLAGLVECYRKICKGNASSVHNLMVSRRSPNTNHKRRKIAASNTPLVIRSFRNPQNPHPVVQYSNPRDRPHSPHGTTRPPVPAPYFYSSRGLPQTSEEGSSRVRLTRLPGASSRHSDMVLAAPGAGYISRSAVSRSGSSGSTHNNPLEGVEGIRPPSLPTNAKIIDSDEVYSLREGFNVPASTPVASTVDINKMQDSVTSKQDFCYTPHPSERNTMTMTQVTTGTSESGSSSADSHAHAGHNVLDNRDMELKSVTGESVELDSKADTSTLGIIISVEDDDGVVKTVNLDEEEELMQKGADEVKSETDISANEVAEKLKESQAKKQAELDQLLEEHSQLVSQIEELEKKKKDDGTEAMDSDDDD